LILRRVALLDAGAGGLVIVGSADHADVLRLEGFLRRNGHPHQLLDPKTDPGAQTLIERFYIDARELPIVLCPNGQPLRNPSDVELARCIGLVKPIDPDNACRCAISGALSRRATGPTTRFHLLDVSGTCSAKTRWLPVIMPLPVKQ
jgi:thioredoxin reductase (NADPH)